LTKDRRREVTLSRKVDVHWNGSDGSGDEWWRTSALSK
jgi:hypothetical protein